MTQGKQDAKKSFSSIEPLPNFQIYTKFWDENKTN